MNLEFYRGKHVFVTGHTGFKGSWLCRMLVGVGAVVTVTAWNRPQPPTSSLWQGWKAK